jgi:alkylation response protein AidB-like acyl-CoA dehydrogenase
MLQKYASHRDEYRQMMKEQVFPQQLWEDIAGLGLLGCLIPQEYGGNDSGLQPLTVAFE